ncbi:MAG: hypothetical protein MK132_12260 [Lentisphaerales bacterium]|nr:hypothetical protein [Lentisphaerales bacterium]
MLKFWGHLLLNSLLFYSCTPKEVKPPKSQKEKTTTFDLPENLKAIVKHDFTYAPDLLKTNKLTLNVLDDVLISLLILGPLKNKQKTTLENLKEIDQYSKDFFKTSDNFEKLISEVPDPLSIKNITLIPAKPLTENQLISILNFKNTESLTTDRQTYISLKSQLHVFNKLQELRIWGGSFMRMPAKPISSESLILEKNEFSHFPKLKKLSVNNAVYLEIEDSFTLPKTMTDLNLQGSVLRTKNWDFLDRSTSLKTLNLASSSFTNKDFPHLKSLWKLKSLNISGLRINFDTLNNLPIFPYLENLNVSKGKFLGLLKHPSPKLLERLSQNPNLKNLDISWLRIKDEHFSKLAAFQKLESLFTVGNNFKSIALATVHKAPKLRKISHINLGKHFNPEIHLDSLKQLIYVEELNLSRAGISDEILRSIGQIKGIKKLNLSYNSISKLPRGLDTSQLTDLNLNYTKVDDQVFQHLKNSHKLKWLHLGSSSIKQLNWINSLKQLNSLDLSNNIFLEEKTICLPKLSHLDISQISIPLLSLETPELSALSFKVFTGTLNITKPLPKIKSLILEGFYQSTLLTKILSRLTNLEAIVFNKAEFDTSQLKINKPSLKGLFINQTTLKEIVLDTPNLENLSTSKVETTIESVKLSKLKNLTMESIKLPENILYKTPNIQKLIAKKVHINRQTAETLSTLTLNSLTLEHCNLSDNILKFLTPLRRLETLSLEGNKLSGQHLHTLGELPYLKSLHLGDNHRFNCSKVRFTAAIFPQLETLNLRGIKISKKIYYTLAENKKLKAVTLDWKLKKIIGNRHKKFKFNLID